MTQAASSDPTDKKKPVGLPVDVERIRKETKKFFAQKDNDGKRIGSSKFGVYAFYDYDGEPIYVGQTKERLSGRVLRHLFNQRTDAVAMNVLDPFEVAEIEVWPFFEFQDRGAKDPEATKRMDEAEFTAFQKVLKESKFDAVLNEKEPRQTAIIGLPQSYRGRIIPEALYETRRHPDIRIARRASTIAALAKVISERQVNVGLRNTLVVQARRLEALAKERLKQITPFPKQKKHGVNG